MDPTIANTPTPALFRFNIHNTTTTTHIEHKHPVPLFLCHPIHSQQTSSAYTSAFIDVLSLVTAQHHTQCITLLTSPCLACSAPPTDCLKTPNSFLNLVEPLVIIDVYPVCGSKTCEGQVRGMILQRQRRDMEEGKEDEKKLYRKVECEVCGKEDAKRCAGCGTVGYCSKACQAQAWKVHRNDCGMRHMSKKKREEATEATVGKSLPYETI